MVVLPRRKLLGILQQYQAREDFTGLAASTRRVGYVALIVESVRGFPAGGNFVTASGHEAHR
jgi:hypothetical protein